MIQRISEPERIAEAGTVATWQVQLNEVPSLEWRRGVSRSRTAELRTRRSYIRIEGAALVFALERMLRIGLDRPGSWIAGINRRVDTRPAPRDRVLVVVNEAAVRTLARESLEEHGYTVLDMADPCRALASRAKLPSQAVSPL